MLDTFDNKPFMRQHAPGVEQAVIAKSFERQRDEFCLRVKMVPFGSIPPGSNIIRSKVRYKVNHEYDKSISLKSCIAPHRNEDSEK